ncbi:hypothetical protein AYO38_06040 [bacterium SCGC AG-212-C10]|nr:hypothetical protein AYO38_06040 [bacterium SCGC AG-212-C10]
MLVAPVDEAGIRALSLFDAPLLTNFHHDEAHNYRRASNHKPNDSTDRFGMTTVAENRFLNHPDENTRTDHSYGYGGQPMQAKNSG